MTYIVCAQDFLKIGKPMQVKDVLKMKSLK